MLYLKPKLHNLSLRKDVAGLCADGSAASTDNLLGPSLCAIGFLADGSGLTICNSGNGDTGVYDFNCVSGGGVSDSGCVGGGDNVAAGAQPACDTGNSPS